MSDSPTKWKTPSSDTHDPNSHQPTSPINEQNLLIINENDATNKIPVEIVSEEEMALLEAALSLAAAAAVRPSSLSCSPRLPSRLSVLCSELGPNSKRTFSNVAPPSSLCDLEDSHGLLAPNNKKFKLPQTFLTRFRRKKGLYVTDLTATVIKRVEVRVESREDIWALKFMNFIICANQLLFEGLTREVPVVGLVQGVWMVGVIDELRIPLVGNDKKLMLVDTKTRGQPRLPTEPQRRNGRLQLMCYKYLWDSLISEKFPSDQFYEYFSLDSQHNLSDDIKRLIMDSDFTAETFGEVVGYFSNFCCMLPRAYDQLLLRYELQKDNSLIGEDEFTYEESWLKEQIQSCLEFWKGEREARFAPESEQWKCRFCRFASVCPSQTNASSQSQTTSQ